MLVLNEKQVKELEAFIQEMPVKFGVPLINLIRKFAEEVTKGAENKTTEDSPKVEVEAE